MSNTYPTRDPSGRGIRHIPPEQQLDTGAYEEDLVVAAERALTEALKTDAWRGLELAGVSLEGRRPATQVAVTMRRPKSGATRTFYYPVWNGWTAHGCPDDGSKPVPALFAANVTDWTLSRHV
jgi:hypothetical protein